MNYQEFANRPAIACSRLNQFRKNLRQRLMTKLGATVSRCSCCRAKVLSAPSSIKLNEEDGVPFLCDECRERVKPFCKGNAVFVITPEAQKELVAFDLDVRRN